MSPSAFEDVQRGHLLTEQVNPASTDLDALSTEELVGVFVAEDRRPQEAVAGASAALAEAIEAIAERIQAGGRLFYLGAGTCLLYTSPSPRDKRQSRMPSSA